MAEHLFLHNKVAIKLLHTHLDTERLCAKVISIRLESHLRGYTLLLLNPLVKRSQTTFHTASDNSEQFLSEARLIASLTHPNIVRVFDFNVDNGIPYIVEDYAPNGTIHQKHPKGSKIPLDIAIIYAEQLAEALQYAHDHRVIHRDVKPENMLLGAHQQILLGDFGIATIAKSTRLQSLLDIAGTVSYMAPEQLRGQPRRASDQYSLAIVIYEWLSGVCPFQGSFTEVASQHLFSIPEPLQPKVLGLSPRVEEVLFIALSKEPEQRFSSVRAFFNALKHASREDTGSGFYSSSPVDNAPSSVSSAWHTYLLDQKEREIPIQHSPSLPEMPIQHSPLLSEIPMQQSPSLAEIPMQHSPSLPETPIPPSLLKIQATRLSNTHSLGSLLLLRPHRQLALLARYSAQGGKGSLFGELLS